MNLRKKQVPVVEQTTRNALTPKKKQCKRCGTAHKFRECPAWGATCDKCGGRNHYASKCLTRRVQVVGVDNDSTGDEGGFFVSAIHNNTQQCEWIALLTVCDSLVPLKVDSGAQVNILSLSDYEGLASKPKLLTERRPKLKTYNEENIETLGICIATVNHMGKKHRLQFVVVSKGRQSLIGASDSERLDLVTRECGVRKVFTVKENGVLTSAEIKKEYPDIFKGLGCLEGTCKIHLRQNYVPSVYPARKVPQSQKQKLKKDLDRLVQTEVLVKAETEREKVRIWCHRIDVLRRKVNTPENQARSGQSCWNLQHASTHDQRGSTESTWHGKLHGQVCAELDGKDNSPETTATREERLAVGSRTGKGMARHKRLLHNGTTPEVL